MVDCRMQTERCQSFIGFLSPCMSILTRRDIKQLDEVENRCQCTPVYTLYIYLLNHLNLCSPNPPHISIHTLHSSHHSSFTRSHVYFTLLSPELMHSYSIVFKTKNCPLLLYIYPDDPILNIHKYTTTTTFPSYFLL